MRAAPPRRLARRGAAPPPPPPPVRRRVVGRSAGRGWRRRSGGGCGGVRWRCGCRVASSAARRPGPASCRRLRRGGCVGCRAERPACGSPARRARSRASPGRPSPCWRARSAPALSRISSHDGHEVVEDLRREGAARHRAAGVLGTPSAGACPGSPPRPRRHVLVAAHEPGVAVVLGRAGLAPDVLVADLRGLAGAARDHEVQHLLRELRRPSRGTRARSRPRSRRPAVALLDLVDAHRPGSSGASVPDMRSPSLAIVE